MEETINLGTGALTKKQVDLILNTLPLELTFVDEENIVRYVNESPGEKIFERLPSAIGRDMLYAHPPKSKHVVEQLLNELKNGEKDQQTAWYQQKDGTMVYITFAAVRDEDGKFMGILEYVQDITEITQIEGENRDVNAK
jgi:hypothetical protein